MRKARASENRRRPFAPTSFQRETSFVRSRSALPIHLDLAPELGPFVDHLLLDDPDGEQRNQPDHRAQPHGDFLPGRHGKHVVEEIVLIVPEPDALAAHVGHRFGDVEEVLQELDGHVLVDRIALAELDRHAQHVDAEHRHPGGAVGLLDVPPGGQRPRPVEHADIVEAEEAALEDVQALRVLAVHPPGEVQQQLVEDALQEIEVAGAAVLFAVVLEHPHGRPGVHGRIDVAERPFVGRQFAVRIHQPHAAQQLELPLGELGVDQGQRGAMECEVPRREPGIFPLVRHGHDVGGDEMTPIGVAAVLAAFGRRRLQRIAVEPLPHVEIVELLVPQHPGKGLALDAAHVLVVDAFLSGGVEEVGLGDALAEDVIKIDECAACVDRRRATGPGPSRCCAPAPSAGKARRPWCRCRRRSPPRCGRGRRSRGTHP